MPFWTKNLFRLVNLTNTSTRTLHGSGSDGSTFKIHVTVHTNIPPTGTNNEFFRCH